VLDALRAIILDFQESEPVTGVPRRLKMREIPGKAAVYIGVRRSGKSTCLFQIMKRLEEEGIPRQNFLYLNFFDDRLHGLRADKLGLVLEAYFALFPQKKNTETIYCFFDEIQECPGWESFVDRLMRTEKCQVYLTGSSATMLSKEIATQMRGRALPWEVFPFSFGEFLDGKGVESAGPYSTKRRLTIQKAFADFWEVGGFPEVVGYDRNIRIKTHQEYFRAILLRDVVERHDVSHPRAASDLAHRLANETASLHTVNKLTAYLKALGHKAPKLAVSDYLGWFEDAYFLFSVQVFDASAARRNANPKKTYCIDHSLVSSVSSGILVNSGHLLENLVFVSLRRAYPNIYYYKTKSGREVDFVLPAGSMDARHPDEGRRGRRRPEPRGLRSKSGSISLVQVSESLASPEVRKRETAALVEAMTETGLRSATIVTREEEGEIPTRQGTIRIVPAWRFLLELPE